MNYAEMPAGREMDALVAEKVMGLAPCDAWSPVNFGSAGGPAMWLDKPCGHDGKCYPTPSEHPFSGPLHYSTSIAAAWEVVERLRADKVMGGASIAAVNAPDDATPGEWCVEWFDGDHTLDCAIGDTAPLAICRAALAAVARP